MMRRTKERLYQVDSVVGSMEQQQRSMDVFAMATELPASENLRIDIYRDCMELCLPQHLMQRRTKMPASF